MELNDKVAIITGAGSGIGRSLALAFAAEGARAVVCTDLNGENAAETASMVGDVATSAVLDVGDERAIEQIVVDTLEGNDRFFIESTSEEVALQVVGGLGSDTFNVGGSNGKEVTVVSNNLEGHSGLVIQTTTTDDPDYKNVFVRDVSVDVRDNEEADVVISQVGGPIRVFESVFGSGSLAELIVNVYEVLLTRAPEENVVVSAAPKSH